MNQRMLLIDGSSLLVSCFYATAPLEIARAKDEVSREPYYNKLMKTSTGIYTNAVYGFTKQILQFVYQFKPDYMAIAFDESRDALFRRKMYKDYKAQRKPSPVPLTEQFKTIRQVLNAMNITNISKSSIEADDIIASIVEKNRDKNIDFYILTKDHDYYQLAASNVKIWMMQSSIQKADALYLKYNINPESTDCPNNCFEFTPELVFKEAGVWPEQIPDLKGIIGDVSDNIPGISGVASPAPTLLRIYGTLENLIDVAVSCENNAEKQLQLFRFWTHFGISKRPYAKIIAGKNTGILSKRLATMKKDCYVPSLPSMKLNFNDTGYQKIKQTLEFNSL